MTIHAPATAACPPRLPAPVRGARAAFVFLTRLPVGGFPYSAEDFRWAPAHFPLVGACIGGTGAAVTHFALPLGSGVAAALALAITIALTGAFHEDGLADTFDALGGSHGRDRILEILKDSRIGAFGATALGLSLVVRYSLLSELAGAAPLALVLAHTAARTGPVWLMTALPYVSGPLAKGSSVARGGAAAQAAIATLWMLSTGAACGWLGAPWLGIAFGAAATAVVALATGRWFNARAGGITGDFLGASEQMTEAGVMLAVLLASRVAPG